MKLLSYRCDVCEVEMKGPNADTFKAWRSVFVRDLCSTFSPESGRRDICGACARGFEDALAQRAGTREGYVFRVIEEGAKDAKDSTP